MLAQVNFGTYGRWFPPQLSVHGGDIDYLIDIVHYFMLLLFVAWGSFFVYALFKFRQREGHKASYHLVKGKISKLAEALVIAFEFLVLVAFSMPVWATYKNDPPTSADRVEVRCVGQQFEWLFHYPGPDGKFGPRNASLITTSNPLGLDEAAPDSADDIQLINEFHIPTGRDIYVRITSKDVIHSFSIPTMRVKQDAIPGMEIPVWFKVKEGATSHAMKFEMTRDYGIDELNWYKLRHHVAVDDYRDKSGQVIFAKGNDLGSTYVDGQKRIDQLRAAGVASVKLEPRAPLEVVCAQLCGNSHFKMKAQMIVHTSSEYEEWVKEKSKPQADVEFEGF